MSKTISCQKMGKAREKWFNNQYVLCTATSMFYVLQPVYFMYYNQYVVCTAISMWYVLQSDCFMYCKQFVLCTAISMFYVLQLICLMYCICTGMTKITFVFFYNSVKGWRGGGNSDLNLKGKKCKFDNNWMYKILSKDPK